MTSWALRLFRHVGLRGLANVEFKLDPRDGQYKLIECNARFTAANGLVAKSGIDLGRFVYCRAVGLPLPSRIASAAVYACSIPWWTCWPSFNCAAPDR